MMGTLTAADLLTPGQRRAKEQRERDALIRTKFNIDNNSNPQYFNGTINRGFKMRDGSIYIEFSQFHSRYQIIITELMGNVHVFAKQIIEQFNEGKRKLITVKGVSGRLNDKGVRNVTKVSFLK
jgi:hypothetical protein